MEQQEDCFFDCQEDVQEQSKRSHDDVVTSQLGAGEGTVKGSQNGAPPSCGDSASSSLSELNKNFEELTVKGPEEELSEFTLAPEESNHGLDGQTGLTAEEKEDWTDTEPELKEELAPEFDDEHLKEIEKDLTEEEKESRRKECVSLKEKGNSLFKKESILGLKSHILLLCIFVLSAAVKRDLFSSQIELPLAHIRKGRKKLLRTAQKICSSVILAIELNPDYVRAILRRAELYEKTDKLDEALEDYKSVLEKDPGLPQAREACMRLPQQIQERNEKLKEEMMGKLKDLGNMILRPFGLSTSNFQVNQDAATGSYSINFVQNPGGNRR